MINFCIFHGKAEAPQGFTSGCAKCARQFAVAPKTTADDVFSAGRKAERVLIASWLRTRRGDGGLSLAEEIASAIERGDHLA